MAVLALFRGSWGDALGTVYTGVAVLILGGVVGLAPLVSSPLDCWCPAQFTASHLSYTNSICTGSTYYLPMEDQVPREGLLASPHLRQYPYYQWTAVCLLLQAAFFFLPHAVWSGLQQICGVSVRGVIASVREVKAPDGASYKAHFRSLAGIVRGDSGGVKLVSCYVIYKGLTLANLVGQLLWMNWWLGSRWGLHGWEQLYAVHRQQMWLLDSATYPRVILCDFVMRHQARVHNYVVQCSLTHSALYESVYLLLWLWLFLMITVTIAGGVNFLVVMAIPAWQRSYVTVRHPSTGYPNLSKDEYFIVRQVAAEDEGAGAELVQALMTPPGGGQSQPPTVPSAPGTTAQTAPTLAYPKLI